ncbi:MAG: hypothetical protein IJW10_03505, partial [Clostridia bacterium]|nr:hypothetical protein [Clostridia bacterium]
DSDEMKSASKGLKDYLKQASLLENESKKNPTYCSRLAKCYGMIGIIYHSLKNKEKEQYYGRKMISLFDFATDDSAKKIALAELAGAMGEVAERHNDKEEYTESVELCKLGVSLVKKSIEIEIGVFDTTEFLCWNAGIRKLLDTLEDALLDPYWHAGLESEGTEEWIYCQELWCKFYKETVKYNVRNYDLLAVKSHELAEVYEKKNDKARAISYYINACEAYIRATSWAGPCITMKCQSMEFYNKSLKEEIQRRERMHEAAIECYERVTRLCYEANDKDKLTDLLRIEELLAWVKPLEVVKTLKKIAREIFEKNDDQGALKCFLRAYEICLNKCKEEKEELIILCRNISSIYGFLGDEEKSREYSEIAKRLRSGE